jgi:hypothetical protein
VFAELAEWGTNSLGFYVGFKLHLVINDFGEILNFQVTPANVDDRPCSPRTDRGDYRENIWRQRLYFLTLIQRITWKRMTVDNQVKEQPEK